jgi:hypothetical protein
MHAVSTLWFNSFLINLSCPHGRRIVLSMKVDAAGCANEDICTPADRLLATYMWSATLMIVGA